MNIKAPKAESKRCEHNKILEMCCYCNKAESKKVINLLPTPLGDNEFYKMFKGTTSIKSWKSINNIAYFILGFSVAVVVFIASVLFISAVSAVEMSGQVLSNPCNTAMAHAKIVCNK